MNDELFKKDLIKHKVYTAWQFIEFTRKNIATVQYCKDTLTALIDNISKATIRWEQNAFFDLTEDVFIEGKKAKKITVTTENAPIYDVVVVGNKIEPWFLFDKILRDFYQYSMNSFDSISQIANAGLLANKGKAVDRVDFQKMEKCFAQVTYRLAFPKTAQWFNQVRSSGEYQYIEAINNRTKHTADIANKLSMGILGSSNTTKIGPFFRKDVHHDEKDLSAQMNATLDFLQNSFEDFLNAFCDEYVHDKYIGNRYHSIGGVYQHKLRNEPENDLSYAFIPVETNFDEMPNEIFILLINSKDEISAHNCPFEHILVRKRKNEIVGRYVSENAIGEDCLLTYRKYVKDNKITGVLCLNEEKKGTQNYYHWNPYFDLETVSDDKLLLERTQSPS